jgi:hypothetical protein
MIEERPRRDGDAAHLHERAAIFFDLLGHRERAAVERERARRARLGRADDSRDGSSPTRAA